MSNLPVTEDRLHLHFEFLNSLRSKSFLGNELYPTAVAFSILNLIISVVYFFGSIVSAQVLICCSPCLQADRHVIHTVVTAPTMLEEDLTVLRRKIPNQRARVITACCTFEILIYLVDVIMAVPLTVSTFQKANNVLEVTVVYLLISSPVKLVIGSFKTLYFIIFDNFLMLGTLAFLSTLFMTVWSWCMLRVFLSLATYDTGFQVKEDFWLRRESGSN